MSDPLHRGLDGVAVAETRLSHVDGTRGELVIGGFPIEELATNATYEESVYLLLHDRLPTATELADFRDALAANRETTDEVRSVLRRAAAEDKPAMDALRMGAAAANLGVDESDAREEAKRVIALLPTLVATYWRYRQGAEPVAPRDDLRHATNYLYMLTGEPPTAAEAGGLETYLNTVVDHGLNASTFSARVAVSTESDLVSAATAAVGTLKGPLHGGAPGPVLDMLREVHASGRPEAYVRKTLDAGERLMGFGHRVYRVHGAGDDAGLFETAREFEDVATTLLAEHKPDRRLETNVEFYTAVLLDAVGVPKRLFTPTFAVSRVGGWMAHALEQLDGNRLIRPSSRYIGETGRSWVPVEDR